MAMIHYKNWKAPTPPKFKAVIRISLILAAGAAALLMAETLGKAAIPDFSYTLLPLTKLICKNVVVAGIVAAALAKATKETAKLDEVKEDVEAIKEKTDKL